MVEMTELVRACVALANTTQLVEQPRLHQTQKYCMRVTRQLKDRCTLDCSYLQVISFLQAQVGLQRLKGVDDVMQLGRTALKHCNNC